MTTKAQITEKIEDRSPGEVFEIGKRVLNQFGFAVVKDRSIAHLLLVRKNDSSGTIDLNFIVNDFEKVINMTLSSETAAEDLLNTFSQEIVQAIQKQL